MTAAGGEVATAHAALEHGDDAGALGALLAAWRRMRHPRIAELVEQLGKRVARGRALPKTAAAWTKLAARPAAIDIDVLLATIGEGKLGPRYTVLVAGSEPDPRIACAILTALLEPTWTIQNFVDWKPLFEGLAASGDPRALGKLATIERKWLAFFERRTKTDRRPIVAGIARHIPAIRGALAAVAIVAPTRDEAAALAAIAAHLARADGASRRDPATEAALLAAIYADPTSDGPRTVYADWLIERGDLRGDFIALQLRGTEAYDPRVMNLEREHGEAWLGTLAPWCEVDSVRFGRGFPAHVRLKARTVAYPQDPAWATVEEVIGGMPAGDANPMPALREVTDLGHHGLKLLAAIAKPPPIATLEVSSSRATAALAALQRLRLPTLRALSLRIPRTDPPTATALACAIGPIERLEVWAPITTLDAWLAAAHATAIRTLVVHVGRDVATCMRASATAAWHLDFDYRFTSGEMALGELGDALARLPAGRVGAVKLVAVPLKSFTSTARQRMAAGLARHPKVKPATIIGYKAPRR